MMNQLLHTPIHRIALRAKASGGIRWSSHVGDVRCNNNSTKISYNDDNNFPNNNIHNFKKNNFHINNNAASKNGLLASKQGISNKTGHYRNRNTTRSFSTSTTTTRKHTSQQRSEAPHERLLVLGSGVAGCATALTAARHGIPVTVLHAGSDKEDCNSYWAQGGVIYRNYRLMMEQEAKEKANGDTGKPQLVDTPLSLVNDIRIASGYTSPLQRTDPLEECTYSSNLFQNNMQHTPKMGQVCPTSGVHWNEDAAWKLACEGPSRVRELLLGSKDDGRGESHGCVVPFDRTTLSTSGEDDDNDALKGIKDGSEDDVLSLCLEASHAAPRIIHYADCTGKVITQSITKAAFEHPLIEFVGDAVVTDLIMDENGGEENSNDAMVIGAQVLNKQTNQLDDFYAVHGVVLASGGLAGIYQHSTNPLGFNALGSSVGLALRLEDSISSTSSGSNSQSNGIVSDLEYVQFHPTSLYLPNEARFLLTEALRGEGAILRDAEGRAFAKDYHPNGELAPRDIVARAVFRESQKTADVAGGEHNAYLDITHRDCTWLKDRFPSIHAHLQSRDSPMNFTKERIPVIPAAHYTCGGVTTDLNGCVVGDTNVSYRNLYAAGEAARTGLHGGNRLASTSLLEGLVFGASVGEMVAGVADDCNDEVALEGREKVMETMHHARHAIEQRLVMGQQQSSASSSRSSDSNSSQEAVAILAHLKSLMWDNVGVVRTPSNLAVAVSELSAIRDEADRLWKDENNGGNAGWEVAALRDAAHAGLAVADAALANRVSGGAHFVELEEDMKRGGNTAAREQDSDDEDDGFVAVRA